MEQLEGRVAVVTGAASGIGRALSHRCADAGMAVVLADVEAGPLDEAAHALGSARTLALPTDVSKPEAVEALAKRAVDEFGAVHLLANNAGVFAAGLSWEAPLSDYEWVFGVNVWGVIHGIRAFVPILLQQEEGHVVNTASMAGLTAAPFCAPYYVSKHAVVCLSETLQLELQAKAPQLGVSVVCPELVRTGIAASERNRPERLARAGGSHSERELVEGAIKDGVVTGIDPDQIAVRALEAVRERRFWVLPPEGDDWRAACEARLDGIRALRNPTLVVPGAS